MTAARVTAVTHRAVTRAFKARLSSAHAHLINGWDDTGGNLSQKIRRAIRPAAPLKTRIDTAQRSLQAQIARLDAIHSKLQRKDEAIFRRIVEAQRARDDGAARAYARELGEVRSLSRTIHGAKIAMERVQARLNTITEFGDVIVTLSPCMSLINGLSASLGGMMPSASESMSDFAKTLNDVLAGSAVPAGVAGAPAAESAETQAILAEAHDALVGRASASLPDLPESLKRDVLEGRREYA